MASSSARYKPITKMILKESIPDVMSSVLCLANDVFDRRKSNL